MLVNVRSHTSCLPLGVSSPGRRRACGLFGVSLQGGYSPTGLVGHTVWLAFPPTGWGCSGVLPPLVEQQGRKAAQPSSGRCGAPIRLGGNLVFPSHFGALSCGRRQATPGLAESGRVDGRWGGSMDTPLVSRFLVSGGMGLPTRRRIVS